MLRREIVTEVLIDAPASQVWSVLTDFGRFPEWNPFIRRAVGSVESGARLDVFVQPSGARGMTFRAPAPWIY